jgi:hypothetical protein
MKRIISIIPKEDHHTLRIETVSDDGYKITKEKEFPAVKDLIDELKKVMK